MFDEFSRTEFGQVALQLPTHDLLIERLYYFVHYGIIWQFFAYLWV